jgi:hypothetical protein
VLEVLEKELSATMQEQHKKRYPSDDEASEGPFVGVVSIILLLPDIGKDEGGKVAAMDLNGPICNQSFEPIKC